MAYTPNQTPVFNAALAGALGGMFSGRAPASATPGDYTDAVNAAFAYAEEFDTRYGTGGDGADIALETIENVVYASFDSRGTKDATPSDYQTQADAAIALVQKLLTVYTAEIPGGTSGPPAFRARNVVQTNVAALAAYTVAAAGSNDNVLGVKGDVVLLVAQTAPAENGPYVIGDVALGTAPLTRPSWWQTGDTLDTGLEIDVGGEGTIFKNTTWQAMRAANTFVVGTADPQLYPKAVTVQVSLGGGAPTGTATISTVPIRSANAGVAITRTTATTTAATVMYGAPTVTPGIIGTASLVVDAQDAAGALTAADGSILNVTITNQL